MTRSNTGLCRIIWLVCYCCVCRNGSVGTSTSYGLDGPGTESRWRRDFPHSYRLALGPTQPPVQWLTGLYPGIQRPERGVEYPPASKAEVKETVVLYLYINTQIQRQTGRYVGR